MKFKSLLSIAIAFVLSGCQKAEEPASTQAPDEFDMIAAQPADAPEIYADYLNRDVRDDVFYFVLPDRFNNANPDNDEGSKTVKISQGGLDVTSKWAFHGGDIQGLEAKLDYLEGMGITAIWMTPILRNRAVQPDGFAHHGYWILDFTEIDPHFGSNDDLKRLINAAHQRGMKIFFDIITNHTADVIKYKECHNPDGSFIEGKGCEYKSTAQLADGDTYTPFLVEGEEAVKTPAWLNDPKYYNNQGDSFWKGESAVNGDFVGLDDLKTSDPDVVKGFIDIYKDIITEFKPDGFRIDTVKHVDLSFWQDFGPAIVDHAKALGIPNFHIFGEVFDANPAVLSRFTTDGKLPSVLDFGYQSATYQTFFEDKGPAPFEQLFANDDYYSDYDSQADLLMNFLGNHDMGRIGYFLQKHQPDASDGELLRRDILAHAVMYLSRGVPVVYYGDEQGFTGDGGDVDSREDMFPSKVDVYNDNVLIGTKSTTAADNFDPQHPIYKALQQLADLRKGHSALRRGITVPRETNNRENILAFSRVLPADSLEYLVLVNTDTQPQSATLLATSERYQTLAGEGSVDTEKGEVIVDLPPLSFLLLQAESPAPAVSLGAVTHAATQALPSDDKLRFSFDIETQKHPLPVVTMKFDILTGNGETRYVATDYAAPYSLIISQPQLDQYAAQAVRVSVTNTKGEIRMITFPIAELLAGM